MSDHNLAARVWATAAVVVVPFATAIGTGWWLPLHMAMVGVVTQVIVGGQLMFSATLGLSRGPSRSTTMMQLGILNTAALLIVVGRASGSRLMLAFGAMMLVGVITWVTVQVHVMWRSSVNRRFAVTGTFYRLAGTSLVLGGSIGAVLGIGAFDDAASYIAHRGVHMTLNVFGWAGMTIVGTAITLLPTILHVRVPKLAATKWTPWLMFGGLLVFSTGATLETDWLTAAGMAGYVAGLASFGAFLREVVTIPRRRRVPTAAFHLMSAIAWAAVTASAVMVLAIDHDWATIRNFIVVGGAFGFAFQALLGAWSFLLPSTRPPVPQRRRLELVAMEVGGKSQVVVYNLGLIVVLVGLLSANDVTLVGTTITWVAVAWALVKTWAFPYLSRLPAVDRGAQSWWADPEKGPSQ